MFTAMVMIDDDIDKLDRGALPALMSLPPFPVLLPAVGEKDPGVSTIGMFNIFSADPLRVGVAVKSSRWTYKLPEEMPDLSLNVPGKDLVDKVIRLGEASGSKVNKFADAGLTPQRGARIRSPIVRECPLNPEVQKPEVLDRSDRDHIWVLGKITHCHAAPGYDRGTPSCTWDGEFRTAGEVVRRMERSALQAEPQAGRPDPVDVLEVGLQSVGEAFTVRGHEERGAEGAQDPGAALAGPRGLGPQPLRGQAQAGHVMLVGQMVPQGMREDRSFSLHLLRAHRAPYLGHIRPSV